MPQNMPTEFGQEVGSYEAESESFGESEAYESGEQEFGEAEQESSAEMEQMEMASSFMEISSEQELDHFLGDLISNATQTVGNFVHSPTGQALGGALKQLAGNALPVIGQAVGQRYGGPAGGMLGNQVGTEAAKLMGLELEGLSNEDREFEVARHFVRFADAAARIASDHARHQHGTQPITPTSASKVARTAVLEAARQFAPGLVQVVAPTGASNKPSQPAPSQPAPNRRAQIQPAASRPAPSSPAPPSLPLQSEPAPSKPAASQARRTYQFTVPGQHGGASSPRQSIGPSDVPPPRYSFPSFSSPSSGGATLVSAPSSGPRAQSGRWYRKGRRVFIYGL